MENANLHATTPGAAAYAAKRAADILFILQNNDQQNDAHIIERLNTTLRDYGERTSDVKLSDLTDLKIVAKELLPVFAAQNASEAAGLLNALLGRYAAAPRLSSHANSPWHLHVDSSDHAPWAEWFVSSSALALAVLLAEKQYNPAGLCASCGRPFIDVGKGGGRKFCSPRCATRERVAAYRKKHRAAKV